MCEKRGCDHFPPLNSVVWISSSPTHTQKKKRAAAAVFKRALEHHTRPLSFSSSFVCVCVKKQRRGRTRVEENLLFLSL